MKRITEIAVFGAATITLLWLSPPSAGAQTLDRSEPGSILASAERLTARIIREQSNERQTRVNTFRVVSGLGGATTAFIVAANYLRPEYCTLDSEDACEWAGVSFVAAGAILAAWGLYGFAEEVDPNKSKTNVMPIRKGVAVTRTIGW